MDAARVDVHASHRGGSGDTLAGQSYELQIEAGSPPRVKIDAGGQAGERYAIATLEQLRTQFGDSLPTVRIKDKPSFVHRGLMLDVSRDRVPTMKFLCALVDALAALKMNHLQLYTEHTFAYEGHECIWDSASPMTPTEIMELDAYCAFRGVELAANQNCFGHLERWLSHPSYSHLAEIGVGDKWRFMEFEKSGPFSLDPTNEASLVFVRELLDQLLPCFNSSFVNVGCDETFDVGQGKSKEAVADQGKGEVYGEFVRQIMEHVQTHGKRPMYWADIALNHPEVLKRLPKDAIALVWGYEADAEFGSWCEHIRDTGVDDVWVCPGTSAWRSITGRTTERRANIAKAAKEGVSAGANGFLLTEWGDLGHRQTWPITLHAIADGANAAWNAMNAAKAMDTQAITWHVFGASVSESHNICAWLDALGDVDYNLRRVSGLTVDDGSPRALRNASVLFNALHPPTAMFAERGSSDDWDSIADCVALLRDELTECVDGARYIPALEHTLQVVECAVAFARARRGFATDESAQSVSAMIDKVISSHVRLWNRDARPGGLTESVAYYQRLKDEVSTWFPSTQEGIRGAEQDS